MAKGKAGKAVKITLIVLFALIVLICGGGYAYYFSITRSPLPQMDGELKAQGLKERVEVIRDPYGIPHIYAKNLHDLFFAQGIRSGAGPLVADGVLPQDLRRQDRGAHRARRPPRFFGYLPAHFWLVQGGRKEYNSFLLQKTVPVWMHSQKASIPISPAGVPQEALVNYSILGLTGVKFKIEPWTPIDTLVFGKLMAWDLGYSAIRMIHSQALQHPGSRDDGRMADATLAVRRNHVFGEDILNHIFNLTDIQAMDKSRWNETIKIGAEKPDYNFAAGVRFTMTRSPI